MKYFGRSPELFLIIFGIVAGLVFVVNIPGILIPLFLVPLFYIVLNTKGHSSLRETIIYGMSFFIPFHAVVLSWFLDVNLAGLVPMSRQTTIFMSYFGVGVMAVILSLGMLPLLWTPFVFRRS